MFLSVRAWVPHRLPQPAELSTMKKAIVEGICLLYVLLFAYAAISKLIDHQQFAQQLQESPLHRFAAILVWLVPASELVLAALLLIPTTRKLALYGSFLLMMTFTLYIIYILKYTLDIPCSCGGLLEDMTWPQHLIFNIVFTALALTAIVLMRLSPIPKRPFRIAGKLLYGSMGIIVLVLIAGAASVYSIGSSQPMPPKQGDPLPEFSFLLMDSTTLMNTRQIPKGRPTVVVYFSPTCGHCQEELIEVAEKKDSLQALQFYFVTVARFKQAKALYDTLHLERYPNVTMGVDTAGSFFTHFRPKGTPFQLIYDKDKKLISIIPGEADVATIRGLAGI